MAKAVKLKNNLYLDTRAIVHNKKILSTILFPIGYVYLSVNNTNPGTIFGGTWEQISGYYLYAGIGGTKTNYTGIGTQGHALTKAQLPNYTLYNASHYHYLTPRMTWGDYTGNIDCAGGETANFSVDQGRGRMNTEGATIKVDSGGSNEKHSHNIATYQIYAWKRVS